MYIYLGQVSTNPYPSTQKCYNLLMKIAYIGLGKMGMGQAERLLEKEHEVVAWNRSPEKADQLATRGAIAAHSIAEIFEKFGNERKIVWLMVPWQAVDEMIAQVAPFLSKGDILIDGGNSPYTETVKRAKKLTRKGIRFMDIGTSGGPGGARNGACLMIGGERSLYDELTPLFVDLSVAQGFAYMGASGAGHFAKMVHNGIEYGMMQAIGEGFEVLKKSEFNLDLAEVARIYNHGSVIESRLVGWLGQAFAKNTTDLNGISGEVSHSGEGEWTVKAARKLGVKTPIIKGSLDFRKKSTGNPTYTGKVVSALRNQFGGHDVGEK